MGGSDKCSENHEDGEELKMNNQTTEELTKTYFQAIVKASEAGNHREVTSLVSELGNLSVDAVVAVHEIRDENGERPVTLAIIAAVESQVREERLFRLLNKTWNTNIWKEEN